MMFRVGQPMIVCNAKKQFEKANVMASGMWKKSVVCFDAVAVKRVHPDTMDEAALTRTGHCPKTGNGESQCNMKSSEDGAESVCNTQAKVESRDHSFAFSSPDVVDKDMHAH